MEKIARENDFEPKKKVSTNQLSNNWALGIIVSESSKEKLKTTLMQNFGTGQTRCIIGDVQLIGDISWPSYFLSINRESVSSHTFINCILELQTFSSGK